MTEHSPSATPRDYNPPGFISDPQAHHNLPSPFSLRYYTLTTSLERNVNVPETNLSPTERTEDPGTYTLNLKRDKAFKQLLSSQVTP